ncbi:MAG: hypothetical protein QG661_2769, partial [Actinomycetota bacterium]|nr:hypothetical protein [Actinomycetota bacterium]
NYSAFRKGQPLYPEWKKSKKERVDWVQPGTTMTAQKLAKAEVAIMESIGLEKHIGTSAYQNLQMPPVIIDHVVSSLTGGLGHRHPPRCRRHPSARSRRRGAVHPAVGQATVGR